MILLRLPYPVSANRYWRSFVPRGHARAIVTLSDEAKAYKREVAWLAKAARVQPIAGRIELRYWLIPHCPQDAGKRAQRDPDAWDMSVECLDLDNAAKVLLDALKGLAFEDDSQIHRIVAERAEPGTRGVIVEVAPWSPPWMRSRSLFDTEGVATA